MIRTFRRKFPRAPIHISAACTVDYDQIQGTVWQIGEGGMFIELPSVDFLPPTLAIDFDLPGLGSHRVVAKPVWRTASRPKAVPDANRGAGCVFQHIDQKTRDAVAAYVKKMKQTYSQLQFELALARPTPQLPRLLKETGLDRVTDQRQVKETVARTIAQLQPNA